jgi:ribosome-binding ATPase YchF (GTP1/OBG family)
MPRYGFCIKHQRFIPIELMDVAGLVEGASEGKGLGNQFLDNLREADAFIQIVDVSGTTDKEGKPTENHDPCIDVQFLIKELELWYLNILNKVWKSFARKSEQEEINFSEAVAKQFSGLKINEDQVKDVLRKLNYNEKASQWSEQQIEKFCSSLLHATKPIIIAANKSDHPNAESNIKKLKENFSHLPIIPCSADSELALREAAKAEMIDYVPGEDSFKIIKTLNEKQTQALETIKENVLNKYSNTGVQQILNYTIFDILKYIAIFPAGATKLADSKGNILPDCYLMPQGSTALDFAFRLHTDFGKNFIKAIDARTKQAKGKEYKLRHRDALEIICR